MDQKKKVERAYVNALFNRLAKLGSAPRVLEERERPDFAALIENQRIGLEVTCSVYQELVRAEKLQAITFPDETINITNLVDRPKRRSNSEILGEMFYEGDEPAWKSCEDEKRDWRHKVEVALGAKRECLNTRGFQQYEKNWLLIFDYPGLSNDTVTFEWAPRVISQVFFTPSSYPLDYDAVFLLSRRYLFRRRGREFAWHYESKRVSS